MTGPQAIDLTPEEASSFICGELARASAAFRAADVQAGLAAGTCALGLGLQLGPSAAEQVILGLLEEAQSMTWRRDTAALSALGPAIIKLVADTRESGAIAGGSAAHAWAQVAEEIGALVGQVGLALAVRQQGRAAMLAAAHRRARLLDEVMQGRLDLLGWLESLEADVT